MSKPRTVRAVYRKVIKTRPSIPAGVGIMVGIFEDLACGHSLYHPIQLWQKASKRRCTACEYDRDNQ